MNLAITTDRGRRLLLTEAPEWSDYHQRFYAWSRRWIAARRKWSGNVLLHNFISYTPDNDA